VLVAALSRPERATGIERLAGKDTADQYVRGAAKGKESKEMRSTDFEAWATSQELELAQLYRTLNKEVFNNRLPEPITIRVVGPQDSLCDAKVLPEDKEIWFVIELLAFGSKTEVVNTMLHEMVHLELYRDTPELASQRYGHNETFERLLAECQRALAERPLAQV
jgi:hypothetical protein